MKDNMIHDYSRNVFPINYARSLSTKTPLKDVIIKFNSVIESAAKSFNTEVELDLTYVDDIKDSVYNYNKIRSCNSYTVKGKEAYSLLPQPYKDAIKLFHDVGYKFEFRADAYYNTQPFEEGYDITFKMKIIWGT